MGTVYRLSAFDNRPPLVEDPDGNLELPDWAEFTAARERFFAGLRSAAELYREHDPHAPEPEDPTD